MPKRARQWTLTINKEAQCYPNVEKLLKQHCSSEDFWALILHDKDTNENGEIKAEHKHAVIKFKNARGFDSISNIFKGAHLEIAVNWLASAQYLIHLNDKSKYQYCPEEIITNDTSYYNNLLEKASKETFNPDTIYEYYREGCDSILKFYFRFGAQINPYVNLIKNLLEPMQRQYEIDEKEQEEVTRQLTDEYEDDDLPF